MALRGHAFAVWEWLRGHGAFHRRQWQTTSLIHSIAQAREGSSHKAQTLHPNSEKSHSNELLRTVMRLLLRTRPSQRLALAASTRWCQTGNRDDGGNSLSTDTVGRFQSIVGVQGYRATTSTGRCEKLTVTDNTLHPRHCTPPVKTTASSGRGDVPFYRDLFMTPSSAQDSCRLRIRARYSPAASIRRVWRA